MRGHFLKSQIEKKSQKVAPLFKIVALFKENFGATFWRFLTQKVAPSDSKHLASLLDRYSFRSEQNHFSVSGIENRAENDPEGSHGKITN